MPRDYKIFISSTYKDLEEYHNAAANAVRGLGYQAITMEDFASSEDKPVDSSLEDLRDSHIYIGIYAFRYGFIPKGYDKSITHLEYEEAGKAKIPRLLFVLDEGTPWPANIIDKDRTKIDDFRESVSEEHVVTISDLNDLKYKIAQSLSKAIRELEGTEGQPRPPIPPALPYLSNRSKQRDDIEEIMTKCKNAAEGRPIVCIIHGNETECHDKFLEKMRDYLLPDLLNLETKENSIGLKRIKWAEPDKHLHKRIERMQGEIAKRLTGSIGTDAQEVVQSINDQKRLIIYFSLQTARWQANEEALIRELFEYWNTLPDLVAGHRVFILLCIKYADTKELPFFKKMKYNKLKQNARRFIESLGSKPYADLCNGVLRELKAVEYPELDDWIMEYASSYCDTVRLKIEINKYYKEKKMAGVPMDVLAIKLKELLSKIQTEAVI